MISGYSTPFAFVLLFAFTTSAVSPLAGQEDEKSVGKSSAKTTSSQSESKVALKEDSKKKDETQFLSTHEQVEVLVPKIDGAKATLSTFRVTPDGSLVACVYPNKVSRTKTGKKMPLGYVQVYNSDFEIQQQIDLPFEPTALDIDDDGTLYVGGHGKVSKVSTEGEILLTVESPNMIGVDMEELKKEIMEQAKAQFERSKKTYEKQIESFQAKIDEIEAVDEDDRTKVQKRALKRHRSQMEMYESILERIAEPDESMIELRLKSSSQITAVTVTESDVFIACRSRNGSGYEVIRTDLNFENPECIIKNLRGCCGQMDIIAKGENIYIAENTKFQVGVYDRDGEKVTAFGERLAGANQGFGSCCNPMNVLCCENGDILTAESSVGKIKRFNADGEMVGLIGQAKIGGGCKHVAIGIDKKLNRFYVQDGGRNQICVLEPKNSKEDSE